MKKVNKLLIAIALIIVTFLVSNSVLAETVSRTFSTYQNGNGRPSGFYSVIAEGGNLPPIIKIVDQDNASNNSVYCFKGGKGFGYGNTATPTTYTQSMSLLQSRASFVSQYPAYESAIPATTANYNSAVALLSIFADTGSTDSINAMIAKVKDPQDNFDFSAFNDYSSISRTGYQKDIVEAVQQAALWYFTNPSGAYHPVFDFDENLEPTFKYSTTNGSYVDLKNKANGNHKYWYYTEQYNPAEYLFMKLVDYGKAHAGVNPSTYASTSTGSTFDKSHRTVVRQDNNYMLVGPYTFTLSDTATLTGATISVSNYKMFKSNKTTEVTGSTFKDKLASMNGQAFYLQVPNSVDLTSLSITINTTRVTNVINCLTVGANNLANNQPLVEYGSKPYSPYVPDVSATNIYTFEFNSWDKTIESVTGDCDYTAKYNVVREELDSLEGLKISFLGDSITTFYKEGSEYNNIYPDGYRGLNNCLSQSEAINNYYPSHSDTVKTWDQTWWGQLLVSTKMELGIVNALSGSMAYDHYNYENGVVAMQDSRVSTLDDNGVPDIVVVFIGTNDICSSQPSWYGKSEYTTALNTIYEKIHKFCNPYTDVFFVQMYLSKSASSYKARVDMYNEVIASVSTDKNCGVIKYADYLSTVSDQSSVLPDWTHPSLKGCGILARASEKAIKEFYGIPCKIKVV